MKQTNHPLSTSNMNTIFGNCTGRALTAMGLADRIKDQVLKTGNEIMVAAVIYSRQTDISLVKGIKQILISENSKMITAILPKEMCEEIINFGA